MKVKKFSADFETATWFKDSTYVWAWACCEIGNDSNLHIGNKIDTFIEFCIKQRNSIFYFHNAKFDCEFIMYWLLKNDFKHIEDKKDIEDRTFTTLIGSMGQFYSMTIYFKKENKGYVKATFIDSLKIIPMPVKNIPKAFRIRY